MPDYAIQVEMWAEEKAALEAETRRRGFAKMNNPEEYIKQELQGLLNQYLDNHSVDEFLEMLPDAIYWKIHHYFSNTKPY